MTIINRYHTMAMAWLILTVAFGITACAVQPKNPSETALMATYALTGVYQSIATLREAGRLTKEDGEELLAQADEAETALHTARIALSAGDQATYSEKILVANRLLLAIEQQLQARQVGGVK